MSKPVMHSIRTEKRFSLDVELDCSVFMSTITMFDIGVSCVVEDAQGNLSYWALSHHGDRPDFHDSRSFGLRLSRDEVISTQ